MKNLSILITDDNSFIRDGIKLSLNNYEGELLINEASNGLEALNLTKKTDYDIILMDMSMPIMGGEESIKQILKIKPKQKILVVSMHSTKEEIEMLKNIGAKGYILKEDVGKQLKDVINRILVNDLVFDLVYY
jgi:DNA-binding NarL/FixJ family response regulator